MNTYVFSDRTECWTPKSATCEHQSGSEFNCCHGNGMHGDKLSPSIFYTCSGPGDRPCYCVCNKHHPYFNPIRKKCDRYKILVMDYPMKYYNQDSRIHHSHSQRHKMQHNSDMSQSEVNKMSQKFDKTEQKIYSNSQVKKSSKTERSFSHHNIKHHSYSDILSKLPIWAITFTFLCLVSFAVTIIIYKY